MADTDPRSDDTLAEALWGTDLPGGTKTTWEGPHREQMHAMWHGRAVRLAAHPAMLARDAALVQQGRGEVAAAVEAREDTVFLGSMSLMDALHATVTEHMWLTETEPPEPVEPYIWCACGWRSDDLGSDNPAASLQVHLTNALHEAATDALQPIVLRKSGVRAAVAAAGASDLATTQSKAWREGYVHADNGGSELDDPYRVAAEAGERQ